MNTVTYGTSSAPYLATRCLNQLATDEMNNYPRAADVLLHNFYVDDVMSGANSVEDANQILLELIELLKQGGFELRKFCTNHPEVLNNVPEQYHETHMRIHEKDVIKTLGLIWEPIRMIIFILISRNKKPKLKF